MNTTALDQISETLKQLHGRLASQCPWKLGTNGDSSEANLSEIITAIEQALATEPENIHYRLWWTYFQLDLNRLPTTAISAPLEEIVGKVRTDHSIQTLAASIFARAASNLAQKNQARLALSLNERAIEFAKLSGEFSASELKSLLLFNKDLLTSELRRAPSRKDSKQATIELEQRLNQNEIELGNFKPDRDEKAKQKVAAKIEQRKRLSSKSILQGAELEVSKSSEQSEVESSNKSTKNSRLLPLAFSFLTLCLAVGNWALDRKAQSNHALAFAQTHLATHVISSSKRELSLPNLSGGAETVQQTLDGVGQRLASLSVKKKDSPSKSESTTLSDSDIDHSALSVENAKKLPRPEQADQDEIVSLTDIPEAENAIKEKPLPKIDPGKYAQTEVEKIGGSNRGALLPGAPTMEDNLRVGADGRIYGPPKGSPPPSDPSRRALDGSPLQSYEVEQFNPPALYRTITSTEVLTRPSPTASSLAQLEPNTPIHVTARMGKWLELRSTGGKVGYIFAQDANPTK